MSGPHKICPEDFPKVLAACQDALEKTRRLKRRSTSARKPVVGAGRAREREIAIMDLKEILQVLLIMRIAARDIAKIVTSPPGTKRHRGKTALALDRLSLKCWKMTLPAAEAAEQNLGLAVLAVNQELERLESLLPDAQTNRP